jgi:hypothetical protein
MHRSWKVEDIYGSEYLGIKDNQEVDQDPELESLSDWFRTIRSLVQGWIHKLKHCVNSRPKSVFKDQEAVKCLSSLHLSETLMLNDIQITSDYMSRWVVLKRRVGAVTSQRVLNVLFYVNILQCFFVDEHFTANVSTKFVVVWLFYT